MLSLLAAAIVAAPAAAQVQPLPTLVPELRLEGVFARGDALHGGAGVGLRAGRSVRIAGLLTAALTRDEDAASLRIETVTRFHFDPEREAVVGIYGGGGLAALRFDGGDWRGVVVFTLGADIGRARRWVFVEAGYGGGLRLVGGVRAR